MKIGRLVAGLALWFGLAGAVRSETGLPVLFSARVVASQTLVRSGPGEKMYATNRLSQGQIVKVLQVREDGWLGIEPPLKSFSWIRKRLVDRGVVMAPAETLIGSELFADMPTVRGPLLKESTHVVVLGKEEPGSGDVWVSIEPSARELRWVWARDVERISLERDTTTTFQVAKNPANSGSTMPAAQPGVVPPLSQPPANHPTWIRAQEAKRVGKIAEAIGLFEQLGKELSSTDYGQAVICYNEAQYLRNYYGGPPSPRQSVPLRTSASYPQAPASPWPTTPPRLALCAPSPAPIQPSSYAASASSVPSGAITQWTGAGMLRASYHHLDGRPTYALESSRGQIVSYATAEPGVDLTPLIGKVVDLHGRMVYRGDIRANYVVVDHAVAAQ